MPSTRIRVPVNNLVDNPCHQEFTRPGHYYGVRVYVTKKLFSLNRPQVFAFNFFFLNTCCNWPAVSALFTFNIYFHSHTTKTELTHQSLLREGHHKKHITSASRLHYLPPGILSKWHKENSNSKLLYQMASSIRTNAIQGDGPCVQARCRRGDSV